MTNVALTGLARDLAKRADEGRPVRIGVIGSGEMGTDLVTQGMLMPGIEICGHLDAPPAHGARGHPHRLWRRCAWRVEADTPSQGHRRDRGAASIAITSNEMLVTNPLIDVVIDATGKPGVAADFDLMAMEHGKHLVMMNVEADVTIGAYLKQRGRPARRRLFGRRRRRAVELHGADRVRLRARLPHRRRPARARTTRSTTTPCPTTIARKRRAAT